MGSLMKLLCLALGLLAIFASIARAESVEDEKEISDLLKETDFIKMLEHNTEKNDKRLKELTERLENELARVNKHFEEMFEKVHVSERNIEKNLEKIELAILGQVNEMKARHAEHRGSWKWPFIILFLALLGVSGFFAQLYRKATKHSHLL